MRKKYIVCAIAVFCIALLIPFKSFAIVPETIYGEASDVGKPEYIKVNQDTGFIALIYDGANLLSDEECEKLLETMYTVTEYGDAGFYTTDKNFRTGGETYYNHVQDVWFGEDSSTVFFIDMENRYLWLHNYGYMEKMIDSNMAESITDNVYRIAEDGEYYLCAWEAFNEAYKVADGQRIARPMKVICNILLSLLLSFFFMFQIIKASRKIPRTDEKEWKKFLKIKVSCENTDQILKNTREVYTGGSGSSGGSGGGFRSGGGGGGHSGGGGGHHGSGGGHHF